MHLTSSLLPSLVIFIVKGKTVVLVSEMTQEMLIMAPSLLYLHTAAQCVESFSKSILTSLLGGPNKRQVAVIKE